VRGDACNLQSSSGSAFPGKSQAVSSTPSPPLAVSKATVFLVRLEVFTAVAMKNAVFWDVTPCGSYKNRRFEGT
jgi:hypothetical protein